MMACCCYISQQNISIITSWWTRLPRYWGLGWDIHTLLLHSTETALLKAQSDIFLSMDDQKVTLLVTQRSIRHNWPQYPVGNLRFRFWCWWGSFEMVHIISFQRTRQVQIKGTLSEKKQLTTGVPQGPCLGPVLFTIYVADLFQIIEKHLPEVQGYADDHQV